MVKEEGDGGRGTVQRQEKDMFLKEAEGKEEKKRIEELRGFKRVGNKRLDALIQTTVINESCQNGFIVLFPRKHFPGNSADGAKHPPPPPPPVFSLLHRLCGCLRLPPYSTPFKTLAIRTPCSFIHSFLHICRKL